MNLLAHRVKNLQTMLTRLVKLPQRISKPLYTRYSTLQTHFTLNDALQPSDETKTALDKFNKQKSNHPMAYDSLVYHLTHDKQYDTAKQILKQYIRNYPDENHLRPVNYFVIEYLNEGKVQEAKDFIDEAEERFHLKQSIYAHSRIALHYARTDIEKAEQYIAEVRKKIPADDLRELYDEWLQILVRMDKEKAISYAEKLAKHLQPDMIKLKDHGKVHYHGISCECC